MKTKQPTFFVENEIENQAAFVEKEMKTKQPTFFVENEIENQALRCIHHIENITFIEISHSSIQQIPVTPEQCLRSRVCTLSRALTSLTPLQLQRVRVCTFPRALTSLTPSQ